MLTDVSEIQAVDTTCQQVQLHVCLPDRMNAFPAKIVGGC
jgi:hypothetical protein